jgi:hypothetical protein
MKPINVSVQVDRPPEDVFAFLDKLANHRAFTDHMLVDWSLDGPPTGVGAKARMRANTPGQNWMDLEVLSVEPPVRTMEETVGAGGRRRTRGTYTLAPRPGGGTDINFELRYLEAPLSERLAAPLVHAYMKRANAKAMRRLGELLAVAEEDQLPSRAAQNRPSGAHSTRNATSST